MWMPAQSGNNPINSPGGGGDVCGVVDLPPVQQTIPPASPFGGQTRIATVFRVRTDDGRMVSCRFEGPLTGVLDQGDRVWVRGGFRSGVLIANRITDEYGAVLGQSSCFVATVAFGDPDSPEVEILRAFRSNILERFSAGRLFIDLYWRIGPPAAEWLKHKPIVRCLIKKAFLSPLCVLLKLIFPIAGMKNNKP